MEFYWNYRIGDGILSSQIYEKKTSPASVEAYRHKQPSDTEHSDRTKKTVVSRNHNKPLHQRITVAAISAKSLVVLYFLSGTSIYQATLSPDRIRNTFRKRERKSRKRKIYRRVRGKERARVKKSRKGEIYREGESS